MLAFLVECLLALVQPVMLCIATARLDVQKAVIASVTAAVYTWIQSSNSYCKHVFRHTFCPSDYKWNGAWSQRKQGRLLLQPELSVLFARVLIKQTESYRGLDSRTPFPLQFKHHGYWPPELQRSHNIPAICALYSQSSLLAVLHMQHHTANAGTLIALSMFAIRNFATSLLPIPCFRILAAWLP